MFTDYNLNLECYGVVYIYPNVDKTDNQHI
jgi:hypothetical protein